MEIKELRELLKTAYRKLKAMPEDSKDITFEEYLLRYPKSEIGKFFAYFEDSPNWDDEEIAAREDHMLCEIIRIDIVNHVQKNTARNFIPLKSRKNLPQNPVSDFVPTQNS